jgi:hypothetical protein
MHTQLDSLPFNRSPSVLHLHNFVRQRGAQATPPWQRHKLMAIITHQATTFPKQQPSRSADNSPAHGPTKLPGISPVTPTDH